MIVFKYAPGASGQPGGWRQLSSSGPFADGDGFVNNPSTYTTIQTGDLDGNGDDELIGRTSSGLEAYNWNGCSWSSMPGIPFLSDRNGFDQAQYYSDIQVADWGTTARQNLSSRSPEGVTGAQLLSGRWQGLDREVPFMPFPTDGPGCCFSNGNSWGDGPAYYATIQFVDIDGSPGDELIGRGGDGLVAWQFTGDTPTTGWKQLATLPDLSDANGWDQPQYYETIQFANIDGAGPEELLARAPGGLNAYSYSPSGNAWTLVSTSTPLALQDDPWAGDPSYYGTIQAGDVDGDGRDDVIGRGPYGIRTWFFNRRGTGGWERYLPYGYPEAFPTTGQQNAFSELNTLGQTQGVIQPGQTVRDVWDGENPPAESDLNTLSGWLGVIGRCSGQSSFEPPQFQTCTPPAGSSGFTAADWTAVMNEMFAEVFWAEQVLDHLATIGGVRQSLFIEEDAELPAIGSDLQLASAAGASTSYDLGNLFAGMTGIAGSVAGPFTPEASAALWVVSELMSMLPSASPTFTSTLTTTYNQLQTTFANGIADVDKALAEQSQLIRQDLGLLRLVGQLRHLGTWNLDAVGMGSAGSQGFALWVYKTLLPTILVRYSITDCQEGVFVNCTGPPSGPWILGDSVNFSSIGPPPTSSSPCSLISPPPPAPSEWTCQFSGPPGDIGDLVWDQQSPTCAYQPGNANTAWTFGCDLGVDPATSINPPPASSENWSWQSFSGDPQVVVGSGTLAGGARAIGRRRAALRLRGAVVLPRRVNLSGARIFHDRLLYEPAAPASSCDRSPSFDCGPR